MRAGPAGMRATPGQVDELLALGESPSAPTIIRLMRKNVGMRVTGRGGNWDGYLLRRVASVWIVVALALLLSSGLALATSPGTNGPIVFSSYGKIYTIQPDGSGLHQVVREDEEHKSDYFPSWSPDGLRIVTSGQMRNPNGYWTDTGLQVFAPDGAGFEHLPISGFIENPAWSPDGSRILFIRERELFSTTPDGMLPTPIESNAWSPAWSPGGNRIAFIRPPDGSNEDTDLYTMGADGGGAVQRLLDLPGWVSSPSWSPDGSTIAFTYMAREDRYEPGPGELPYTYSGPNIYTVPATGGKPVQLTKSSADTDPVWSPDGSTIAFQSDRRSPNPPDLYLMDTDGSNQRRLTTTIHCLQCGPDWASLPPHSSPSAPAPVAEGAEPPRTQEFSRISITRTRFAQPSRVWLRFRAAVAEKVGIAIRRAVPPDRASRCGRQPGACLLTGQDQRQVREGFNRISLGGLLGSAPTPGRYWLQLSSSSSAAGAGLAFRVMPPRDGQRRSHSR